MTRRERLRVGGRENKSGSESEARASKKIQTELKKVRKWQWERVRLIET